MSQKKQNGTAEPCLDCGEIHAPDGGPVRIVRFVADADDEELDERPRPRLDQSAVHDQASLMVLLEEWCALHSVHVALFEQVKAMKAEASAQATRMRELDLLIGQTLALLYGPTADGELASIVVMRADDPARPAYVVTWDDTPEALVAPVRSTVIPTP